MLVRVLQYSRSSYLLSRLNDGQKKFAKLIEGGTLKLILKLATASKQLPTEKKNYPSIGVIRTDPNTIRASIFP